MFSFKWIYFVIFTLILCESKSEISDKRLCLDKNCSEIISVGKTILRYASPEKYVLSFAPNDDVTVYSYGAGTRPELVGVEIKGKRGYINKAHFREVTRIKRPQLLLDTELVTSKSEVPLEGATDEIKADPTRQLFDIVDGTKIPLDIDSFSTEAPAAYILSEETSESSTKPLDSVPDNENVNPGALREEPTVVNSEQNKDIENQQAESVNKDEDSDDKEDDPDDVDGHGDEGDEENVPEKVVENTPSEVPGVVINDPIKSDVDVTVNAPDKNIASTAEKIQITPEYNSEIKENIKKAMEEAHKETEVAKDNTEESLPLVTLLGAIEVEKNNTGSSEEANNENSKENTATDNAASMEKEKDALENTLDKTTKTNSVEEQPNLPGSTTEAPIDFEVIPPVVVDVVTPDPVNSQDVNNLEDNENNTEESHKPNFSLPSELMPEFKDPEEGVDIKIKQKSSGGWFGGQGGILPMFNSGDDREIGEDSTTPDSKGNDIVEDIVHDTQPIDSESSSNDGLVSQKDDFYYANVSEEAEQNNEPLVLESDPSTTEQIDSSQSLNSDTLEQVYDGKIESNEKVSEKVVDSPGGIFSSIISFFHREPNETDHKEDVNKEVPEEHSASSDIHRPEPQEVKNDVNVDTHNPWSPLDSLENSNEVNNKFCEKENCPKYQQEAATNNQRKISNSPSVEDLQILFVEAFSSDLFLYLTTTALSVIFLVFGMVILDKCRREGPLIARINKLEQQLLTTVKENEMLQEKNTTFVEEKTQLVIETVPNEVVDELNQKLAEMHQEKLSLEEQIQVLEKELDTSTEVGIELNKIITEMLNSSDGSEIIKENIEQMQKKLLEQQDTINTINDTLSLKETENHELTLEMEISNRKVTDLQSELDRLVEKIVRIEEERDHQHSALENEVVVYQTKCKDALSKEQTLNSEIQVLKQQLTKFQRLSELKVREYNSLKENLNELKAVKNNKDVLKSLLEVSEIKAQLQQLKSENMKYTDQLSQEREANAAFGIKIEHLTQEINELRDRYEKADKEKVEVNTKLHVLNNYFKEKEDQMQKEISRYESLWAVKEGEATSTTERIRYMQEELQNYKSQNESLKQEIVNQEVELKSQITVLEKRAHESWMSNRQTERKLEEVRQEAAQLRNRLTMRERAIAEGNNQTRMQSPLHQNGELPISPPPMDPTQSPPPLFNPRDHLAKSPQIPGMPPPPFLPLGATPFIPPPPLEGMMPPPMGDMGGMPPPPHFMPPLPPGMYPGDHRPPPLGRMSSPPPVGGRYTPESTVYSDYDRYSRRSPSPPYDSEYRASPPPIRAYSPYQDRLRDDRREYKRPQARSNGRGSKGMHSSGSENDSLGKPNKTPQRKV